MFPVTVLDEYVAYEPTAPQFKGAADLLMKSGLKDTMWDLIVNCFGALTISILGWGYLRTEGDDSFLEKWVHKFIERNPHLFERRKSSR